MGHSRSDRVRRNALWGAAAEDQVAAKYRSSGFTIQDQRFRSSQGEIDVIASHNDKLYFVEVKRADSHDAAVARITPSKIARLRKTALSYLSKMDLPLNTDMRFDAALVNKTGTIRVIPNAF